MGYDVIVEHVSNSNCCILYNFIIIQIRTILNSECCIKDVGYAYYGPIVWCPYIFCGCQVGQSVHVAYYVYKVLFTGQYIIMCLCKFICSLIYNGIHNVVIESGANRFIPQLILSNNVMTTKLLRIFYLFMFVIKSILSV